METKITKLGNSSMFINFSQIMQILVYMEILSRMRYECMKPIRITKIMHEKCGEAPN